MEVRRIQGFLRTSLDTRAKVLVNQSNLTCNANITKQINTNFRAIQSKLFISLYLQPNLPRKWLRKELEV